MHSQVLFCSWFHFGRVKLISSILTARLQVWLSNTHFPTPVFCQSAPETLKQHFELQFPSFSPQKAEVRTGCTEGTRKVKSKVVWSLDSKFQGIEQILRIPFHIIQIATGSLCEIFSAKSQDDAKVNVGVKTPQNKKNEELLMLWDNRTKPIYSVSCDICLVTNKLSCKNPLCFTYSDCHLVEALF